MLVDTHCHIHELAYPLPVDEVIQRAHKAGVGKMICVGTSQQSSHEAVDFTRNRDGIFAAVGVHPHEAKVGWGEVADLLGHHFDRFAESVHSRNGFASVASQISTAADVSTNVQTWRSSTQVEQKKIVAVGEIGLDYFYTHSLREVQIKALEAQIDLALTYDLPIIFHVREAFDDFWPIFDNFRGIRGELHSFTDSQVNLEQALKRDLFIGVNGISTFTKKLDQQVMYAAIPLSKMLLETDAPFLTPAPFRGKMNEPAFVRNVAEYHAKNRGIAEEEIASVTTANAHILFALS